MSRFKGAVESQAGQLAGLPVTTTFNGYIGALVAGASQNFKIRRCILGLRTTTAVVPTSQQYEIAIYRQTVRVVGTGFSTIVMQNQDTRAAASQITGIDITTAATAGTTGPTIGANPLERLTLNTQSAFDCPYEMLDEWFCDQGTANGIAFVNIGAALPANHIITISLSEEE